jgi:hypothetical protein
MFVLLLPALVKSGSLPALGSVHFRTQRQSFSRALTKLFTPYNPMALHGLTWTLWFARRYSKRQMQIQNDFSGPYTIFAHRRGGE